MVYGFFYWKSLNGGRNKNKNKIHSIHLTFNKNGTNIFYYNKAYRPNAHLLYIEMHCNGNII